jgi:hypothetical protein
MILYNLTYGNQDFAEEYQHAQWKAGPHVYRAQYFCQGNVKSR